MALFSRLKALFRDRRLNEELDDEIRSHIEMRTEANLRSGMSAETARDDAMRRFGNSAIVKEDVRSADILGWLDTVARDARFALRMLRKSPAFTVVAVLTLALGIGANTAIFSVVYAVLLKPLPYSNPEQIVMLQGTHAGRPVVLFRTAYDDYRDWEKQATSFSHLAMCTYWSNNVTGIETPERIVGMAVTGQFFPLLGVNAMLGRALTADDDRAGAPPVTVLSYSLWNRLFGARRDIVGKTIVLNAVPYNIVGVMPSSFAFPVEDAFLWTSLADNMEGVPRNSRFLMTVGRLKPGVTLQQAQSEMDVLSKRLEAHYPDSNKGWGVQVVSAQQAIAGNVRSTLVLLLISIGAVLLIACANVANLLLARMVNRQKELAVRVALGASRWRLVRQTVTENLVLSFLGAALAVAIAYPAVEQLKRLYPADMPRLQQASLSVPVLLFALGITVLVGLLLGLLTALRITKANTTDSLKQASGTTSHGRAHERFRRGLVVAEISISVVLLIGGGLLVRSLSRVMAVDPGFRTDNVLTFNLWLVGGKFKASAVQTEFVSAAIEKIKSVAGVESVSAITQVPMSQGGRTTMKFQSVENPVPVADAPQADYRAISPGYFETMGVPLVSGRPFTDSDKENAPRVIIVNHRLAEMLWPGQNALGKRLRWNEAQYDVGALTIVGVAGDVRSQELAEPDEPSVYVPYPQRTLPYLRWVGLAVRTKVEPMALWPEIRQQVLGLDADRAIYNVSTTKALVEHSIAERAFNALMLGIFSALALLLAAIGIYGLVSYAVSQRAREFGIRMALGARAADVRRLVLNEGLWLAIAGIALGTVVALFTSGLLRKFLFGLGAYDPVTFIGVPLLLAGVAVFASYLPARRAIKVNPMTAIRNE